MFLTKFFCSAVTVYAFCCLTSFAVAQSLSPERPAPKNLYAIARTLDCYLTVELYYGTPAKASPLDKEMQTADFDASADSIEALLPQLRMKIPDAIITRDTENPAVIHIADRSLQKIKRYVLDDSASLRYFGRALDMADTLGKQTNGGLAAARGFVVVSYLRDFDPFTNLRIMATNRPVRSILDDYLPLSDYGRLLWKTSAKKVDGSWTVRVLFPGRVVYTKTQFDKEKEYHFSEGEEAYQLNPNSNKLTAEAMRFVTASFQSGKTLNVRWSMYYLGKQKVESAIPLLLSHLDYRYTTVPVLAEAYPAVHALLAMGKLSTAPVQKQLTTETDPLRLQLLCAVLLGVHGAYDGRRLTAETAAKLPEAQEKRIMDALRIAEEQLIAVPPPVDNVSSPHPVPIAP